MKTVVLGENITIAELKKTWFGYNDFAFLDEMVDSIEVNGRVFTVNEEGDYYITFPIIWEDSDLYADCTKRDKPITVYEFITDYYDLDENDLEDFTFYFCM